MNKQTDHLETLTEIRSMMERSTRFISLSGLSGVFAGIFALIGATAGYLYLDLNINSSRYYEYAINERGEANIDFYVFFFADAISVLLASLVVAFVLTQKKARKKGQQMWDATAKRLMINTALPLITGGLFCIALLYHELVGLIAPTTLVFYGMALLNASKYTYDDIRYLGLCEIALGLIAMVNIGFGLIFWAIGFGVLHIVYGIVVYNKYEK